METDKPTNGEAEKKDGETAEKSAEGGEGTKSPAAEEKTDVSEVKSEDSEAKGELFCQCHNIIWLSTGFPIVPFLLHLFANVSPTFSSWICSRR